VSLVIPVDDALALRLVQPQHAQEIAQAVASSREHINRWLPWATPGYDVGEARVWAQAMLKAFDERKAMALSVLEHGRVVGGSGWTDWRCQDNTDWQLSEASADVGYWLAKDAQGRGIMTRAVRALLDYGFGEVGLHRITVRAEPDNQRSCVLPERLGFTREGTMRHVFRWQDRWVDHQVYAMLAEDWPEARQRSVRG